MAKPKNTKLKPVRVPSDDFTVNIDGDIYYPHAGEWVEIIPRTTVGEMRAMTKLQDLGNRLEALDDADDQQEVMELLDRNFELVTRGVASRLYDWNWTDDLGRPLPKPDGTSEPLELLSTEELYYLLNASNNRESKADRKNGSRAMQTTGSGTRQPQTQT